MDWYAYLQYPGPPDAEFSATVINTDGTHNINRIIHAAIEATGDTEIIDFVGDESWWKALNGMNANWGAYFLDLITGELHKDPEKYRALNPENGWGDYDSILETLQRMKRASVEHPLARWSCGG